MFKHGFDKKSGCQGRSSGCTNFHPKICEEQKKGNCSGRECNKGFHLRSIARKFKKPATLENGQTSGSQQFTSEVRSGEELNQEPTVVKDRNQDDFLSRMEKKMEDIMTVQKEQARMIQNLLQKDQNQIPEWLNNLIKNQK